VEACWQSPDPLGLFVLIRVLESVENFWNEQGFLTQHAATSIRGDLLPPIHDYLDAASAGSLAPPAELAHLGSIVAAFLRWRANRADS
jgi:hypothetical protein